MRTLSDTLLAAQKADTGESYIRIYLSYGETTYDYSSRLMGLNHTERLFGGQAIIRLNNSDKAVADNLTGYKVTIGYGFTTESGDEYSNTPPLWVYNHRRESEEGVLTVELECIDAWQLLQLSTAGNAVTDGVEKVMSWVDGSYTIEDIVEDILGYGGITLITGGGDSDLTSIYPFYRFESHDQSLVSAVIDVIGLSLTGLRMENDGDMHEIDMSATPGSYDYVYELTGDHVFYSNLRSMGECTPNTIIFTNHIPDEDVEGEPGSVYTGVATDDDSVSKIGNVVRVFQDASITSVEDAESRATTMLTRIQNNRTGSTVVAPMNCGQQLLDYVQIKDSRSGYDVEGWVGKIDRIWVPGLYRIEVTLGQLQVGLTTHGIFLPEPPGDAEEDEVSETVESEDYKDWIPVGFIGREFGGKTGLGATPGKIGYTAAAWYSPSGGKLKIGALSGYTDLKAGELYDIGKKTSPIAELFEIAGLPKTSDRFQTYWGEEGRGSMARYLLEEDVVLDWSMTEGMNIFDVWRSFETGRSKPTPKKRRAGGRLGYNYVD